MMDVKAPKVTKTADGLIERTQSMIDEIESKTGHKDKVSIEEKEKRH